MADMGAVHDVRTYGSSSADSAPGAHLAGNAISQCRLQEPWLARFLTGTRTASADPV